MADIPAEVKDPPVDDPLDNGEVKSEPQVEIKEEIKAPVNDDHEEEKVKTDLNPVTIEEEHKILGSSTPHNQSIDHPTLAKTSPPGSPKVFISLKSPTQDSLKRSNLHLEIADSLFDRKIQTEAKISKMRVQQIANEVSQLQSIPTINKKSKLLVSTSPVPNKAALTENKNKYSNKAALTENKNKYSNKVSNESEHVSDDSFLQLIPDSPKSVNQSKLAKAIKEHAVFDNSELIKSAVKLRENIPAKPEQKAEKKMKLADRNKKTKEKKIKKIKEAEQEKKIKELEGCTFKPKILNARNQISESGTCIIKRSNSGSIIKNDLASPTSPRANKAVLEFFDTFQLREAKVYSVLYSQVSPVNYNVRHKHGYNVGAISSKAQPMVDYRVIAANLLE